MKKREVSMTELFFDLIFVYILSTINQTAEGISHNLMSLEEHNNQLFSRKLFNCSNCSFASFQPSS